MTSDVIFAFPFIPIFKANIVNINNVKIKKFFIIKILLPIW